MSDLKATMQAALKDAMVNKDTFRRDTIRSLMSAVKQVEIDTRKDVDDVGVSEVLQREAKKRRESIEESERVGRQDLADHEKAELAIITTFLPKQLTLDELRVIVQETITQTGVTTAKEMGKLMGALMPKVKGLADGKAVNEVVKSILK